MVRKSKTVTMIFLTVCSAVVFAGSIALAGNPGEAGLLSLRMGVGAREAGMGGSGVASSHGASAVFWNPANNVFADFETELVLQHYNYLGLFNQESAAVAHKAKSAMRGRSSPSVDGRSRSAPATALRGRASGSNPPRASSLLLRR